MGRLKIAYVVATPELQRNERVTAMQCGLEKAFQQLRESGYDGAELMIGDPDEVDPSMIERLAGEFDLEVPAFCTGEMYGQYGLSFMDPDKSVRKEALAKTRKVIDCASSFGALVNIGRLRGRFVKEVARDQSLMWMFKAFEELSDYAAGKGVTLILEPVAHPFCNVVNSTRDGIEAVQRVGRDNFRLMLDVFSMHIEDRSMAVAFSEARQVLRHIHLCDSNRLAPGMGIFDFEEIMRSIRAADYEGYVSAEISQAPNEEQALEQTTKVLMPLVRSG